MNRLFLLSIASAATMSAAHAADLDVAARDAAEKGTVYFALFDQHGFLGKPIATAKSEPGKPAVVFRDIAPGRYALSVFQDLNGNGKMDRNLIGSPTEPFEFINDAMGNMGPPKFDPAAVEVGAEGWPIAITLR